MESTPQEEAEGRAIVKVLAVVLERLVSANSHLAAAGPSEETKFHALRAPAIGILQYLERIHKYASCSKKCFILALVYIDRLIQRNSFLLTELNVHRVVVTAVLLAAKFFDDAYYNNAYYAKVGGVLVSEMNALEVEFLFKIDFGLRVLPEVFDKYRAELISHSSAVGLDRISHCTDEELFCGNGAPQQQGHVQAPQYHPGSMAAPAQAPLLQTYSQTEFDPRLYPNSTPAAPMEVHYATQALQQSSSSSQMQVSQHQQQTASVDHAVYPFPTLAPQVSVQQHAQAPIHNPSELDLVYPHAAPVPMAAPQDVSLNQYPVQQAHHSVAVAAPQAQAYAPPELKPTYYAAPTPAGMGQGPAYPNLADYSFNMGQVQAMLTQPPRAGMLQGPEITPSPPPQPPINMHGAPACIAYRDAMMGCSTSAGLHLHQPHHQYPTPADAAADLHYQPPIQSIGTAALLPSRPIAIVGGNRQIAHDQDRHGGSWTRMVTLEGRASDPR